MWSYISGNTVGIQKKENNTLNTLQEGSGLMTGVGKFNPVIQRQVTYHTFVFIVGAPNTEFTSSCKLELHHCGSIIDMKYQVRWVYEQKPLGLRQIKQFIGVMMVIISHSLIHHVMLQLCLSFLYISSDDSDLAQFINKTASQNETLQLIRQRVTGNNPAANAAQFGWDGLKHDENQRELE